MNVITEATGVRFRKKASTDPAPRSTLTKGRNKDPRVYLWELLGYELSAVNERREKAVLTAPDVQAGLAQALAEMEAWKTSLE